MKHSLLKIVPLLLLIFCAASVSYAKENIYTEVPASESDALLKRVKERLGAVRTIKARFVQERRLSAFLDVLKSEGVMYFDAANKLRWEITEPYRSILIFNDGKVAKFSMTGGEFRKMKLGMEELLQEVLRQNLSFMRGDFDAVKENYSLTITKGKDYKLALLPVSAGMAKAIKSIELYMQPSSGHITRIVTREPQGDFIEIRFYGEEEDLALPAELFNLDRQAATKR